MATERELIEDAQRLKATLENTLKELTRINKEAGRQEVVNAIYLTRAELNVWHGKATERLFKHFPGFASDIVAFGPGGR